VSAGGDAGCIITSHTVAVEIMIDAEYGP
jgi:hypothetical protein